MVVVGWTELRGGGGGVFFVAVLFFVLFPDRGFNLGIMIFE